MATNPAFPAAAVVYISDERVAATYNVYVGDFATINDPEERAWLVANNWAYDNTSPELPAAYHHGNRGAWTGYTPEPPPEPEQTKPAATPTVAKRRAV